MLTLVAFSSGYHLKLHVHRLGLVWSGHLLRPIVDFDLQAPVILDTHPGLLEAIGPPAVIGVVRDALGLLELLPQPLYPVMVARG